MAVLRGYVYSRDGRAVGAAYVRCGDKLTLTNFDGEFRFNNLESGTYTISVNIKGFKRKEIPINLKDRLVLTIYLDMEGENSKIYGYIYDAETGMIVDSGIVMLILPFTNRYTQIGKNGYYEFNGLPSGTYEVIASPLNYLDEKASITLLSEEVKQLNFFCKRKAEEAPWG